MAIEKKKKKTTNFAGNKKNRIGRRKDRKPPKAERIFRNKADERTEQLKDETMKFWKKLENFGNLQGFITFAFSSKESKS